MRSHGFSRRRRDRTRGWFLFLLLAALYGYAYATKAPPAVDYRMEVACSMPKRNGEATFIVVLEGKLICWKLI